MSSLHQLDDVDRPANDQGYQVIRSHSSTFNILPDSQDGTLSIQLMVALLSINEGGKRYIVDLGPDEVKEVYSSYEGRIVKYGTTKKGKGSSDVIIRKTKTDIDQTTMGCDDVKFTAVAGCKISRIAIAWWTDPEGLRKTIRIFGDRILLTTPHIVAPSLIDSWGHIYNLVYPESEAHPDHCSKCKKRLRNSQAHTQDFLAGVHVENPPRFLCEICKYQLDTGFLPVSRKK